MPTGSSTTGAGTRSSRTSPSPARGWLTRGVESLAPALQAGDAGELRDRLGSEQASQGSGVLAHLVDPYRAIERLRERGDRGHHVFDRGAEVPEDLGGLDPRIPADRDHGRRPDEHDLGLRGDLVDHRHRHDADPVVQDDDVRLVGLDLAGEVGDALGLADDVEALALEDEAKEALLRRPAFADDDPYPSCHTMPPQLPCWSVPHPLALRPQPDGGFRAEGSSTAVPRSGPSAECLLPLRSRLT